MDEEDGERIQLFSDMAYTVLKDIVFMLHSVGESPRSWEEAARLTCDMLYMNIMDKPPIEGNPREVLGDKLVWKGATIEEREDWKKNKKW